MILFTFGVLIAVIGLAAGVICGFLELLSIPILIVYFLYVVAAEIVSKIKQKKNMNTSQNVWRTNRTGLGHSSEEGFINNDLKVVKSQDEEK